MGQGGSSTDKKNAEAFLLSRHTKLGEHSPASMLTPWLVGDIVKLVVGDYEIGYKGFSGAHGKTFRDFAFPLDGTIVELPRGVKPVLCNLGYHFCPMLKDVDNYFPFQCEGNLYAEVAAMGRLIHDTRTGKSVASRMQVVRMLTVGEIRAMKAAAEREEDPPGPPHAEGLDQAADGGVTNYGPGGRMANTADGGPAYRKKADYIYVDEEGMPHRDPKEGSAFRTARQMYVYQLPHGRGKHKVDSGFREGWMQHGRFHRDPKEGPAQIAYHMNVNKRHPVTAYAFDGHLHRPQEDGPAVFLTKRWFLYAERGVPGRDAKKGPAMSLPCGMVVYMEDGMIHRDPKDGPAVYRNKPLNAEDNWCDWFLGLASHADDLRNPEPTFRTFIELVRVAYDSMQVGATKFYERGIPLPQPEANE